MRPAGKNYLPLLPLLKRVITRGLFLFFSKETIHPGITSLATGEYPNVFLTSTLTYQFVAPYTSTFQCVSVIASFELTSASTVVRLRGIFNNYDCQEPLDPIAWANFSWTQQCDSEQEVQRWQEYFHHLQYCLWQSNPRGYLDKKRSYHRRYVVYQMYVSTDDNMFIWIPGFSYSPGPTNVVSVLTRYEGGNNDYFVYKCISVLAGKQNISAESRGVTRG